MQLKAQQEIRKKMKNSIFAFDVYGTLINTSGVYESLRNLFPQQASSMVEMWRNKQLEYSFRQTAMGIYKGFSFCTQTALDYVCKYHDVVLTNEQKNSLLQIYNELPAFDDVKTTLSELKEQNRVYAFSNGESAILHKLLDFNKLTEYFHGVVSVEKTKHFKPSPQVYAHFNEVTNTKKEHTFLVSSNPFDVIGAAHVGFKTIWVQRTEKSIFDTWGIEPTFVIKTLADIKTLKH